MREGDVGVERPSAARACVRDEVDGPPGDLGVDQPPLLEVVDVELRLLSPFRPSMIVLGRRDGRARQPAATTARRPRRSCAECRTTRRSPGRSAAGRRRCRGATCRSSRWRSPPPTAPRRWSLPTASAPPAPPPIGTAWVPERIEKRPVMIADRLGVHCASTLKLVRRMPSAASAVDARRRRAARAAAAVAAELAVAEVVREDEDDVGACAAGGTGAGCARTTCAPGPAPAARPAALSSTLRRDGAPCGASPSDFLLRPRGMSRRTQRKPMWLMPLSTICAWRAAGR